jgi:hypothetical protein
MCFEIVEHKGNTRNAHTSYTLLTSVSRLRKYLSPALIFGDGLNVRLVNLLCAPKRFSASEGLAVV